MPQTLLPHLAARILGTPLMVDRARLETILSVIGPRIGLEPSAMPPGFEETDTSSNLMVTPNGIAIVPIHGTLVKRAGAIEAASGLTSYTAIEERILDAATDPGVRAILLDIDSPGGEVGGVFDLAALILEAGQDKPVWALADDAFSAAYLIASTAHRIIVPQTAGVGSVGVIAVHVDESAKDAQEGRTYTTVFAGARKNDFSSHAPLSDEARIGLQREVDRLYGMFVAAVASGRQLSESAVHATEAGLFFGGNAINAGLADQVGTIRDALAGLSATIDTPKKTHFHRAAQPPEPMHKEAAMPMDTPAEQTATAQPKPEATQPVDLDKLRAEQESHLRGEAQAIVDLCALAGMPDLAGGFIAQGMTSEAVRRELLAKRAQSDGPEIHSQVMPGDGTRIHPAQSLESNPVVASCRKIAQQHAHGGN
ncbi:S49 family peptidase [Magnetofaba australis]|uniref:Putative serine peptidase n=1 Tax=Magnetofaba australis IT-1 TaxID=1434232 RepID=A0A1Y2KC11_9PROT|nr:S49 family peptidase [Magnetofaba australis]OSM07665.1 putative serine peptidase [Magnetofaba australis IT-1]